MPDIFNLTSRPIIILDNSFVITDFNDAAKQLTGVKTGTNFSKVIYNKRRLPDDFPLNEFKSSGKKGNIEFQISTDKFVYNLECLPIYKNEQSLKEVVVIFREIKDNNYKSARDDSTELIFNSISDLIALIEVAENQQFRIFSVNEAYYQAICGHYKTIDRHKLYGLSIEELGKRIGWPKALSDDIINVCVEIASEKKSVKRIEKIIAGSSTYYFDSRYTPILNENNTCRQILYVARDITESKETEFRLLESELRFRSVFMGAADGIIAVDRKTTVLDVNKAFETITGISGESVKGKTAMILAKQFITPPQLPGILKLIGQFLKTGEIGAYILEFRGKFLEIKTRTAKPGGITIGILRDITDQKKAEDALKESEYEYRLLFENSTIAIGISDTGGKALALNNAMQNITGYTLEEFGKIRISDTFVSREERNKINVLVQKKGKVDNLEVLLRRKSGEKYWASLSVRKIKYKDGEAYLTSAVDITERKNMEEALRRNEERFRRAQSIGKVGNWEYNLETTHFWGSEEAKRIYGFDLYASDFTTDEVENCIPEREWVHQVLIDLIEKNKPYDIEFDIITKNKRERKTIHSIAIVERDNKGNPLKVSGVIKDITESKRTAEELEKIKWLLTRKPEEIIFNEISQPYGDPSENNKEGLILKSVGRKMLADIVGDYLGLLETSAAVYEKNGDYAFGIFSSGWCKMLDNASYHNAGKHSINETINSGKWLCHESCWNGASKKSIRSGLPADIECYGGLHIFAVPIIANGEAIGSVNFGYGDPPDDQETLKIISRRYNIPVNILTETARKYQSRPSYIIELAKQKLKTSAHIIGSLVEINQTRKKLSESENRFNLAMNASQDGLYDWNLVTNEIYYSPGWKKMLGYEYDQLPNDFSVWEKLTAPEDVKKSWQMLEKVINKKRERFVMEFRMKHKDGRWINILSRASAFFDENDRAVRMIGTHVDITGQKKVEEELQKYHLYLEDMVTRRTAKLEAANKELEAFAYSVSHDLRAPLRAIDGFSQYLEKQYSKSLDNKAARYINIIRENTTKMDKLITDLLQLSRLSRSELNYVNLDMNEIVRTVFKEISTEKEYNEFDFILSALPDIEGDSTSIHQVWTNLINNALKYSSDSPVKRIEIGAFSEEKSVTYFVKDQGCGFDMEYKDKLFGVFQRLHSGNEYAGTGVGLAIVKRIVEKHGGTVRAEGNPEKGATFSFTLPVLNKDQ